MNESRRWALPLLAAGQAQKEVTHNEAILAIDRLLQLAVVSRSQTAPPADAAPGDVHIVGPEPTGAWAGHAGQLTAYEGGGWTFTVLRPGCLAWVGDEQVFAVMMAGGWSNGGWPARGLRVGDRSVLATEPVHVVGTTGGSTVDLECRSVLADLLLALRNQGIIT